MNVVDQKDIDKYRDEKFDEVESDMHEEFFKYGDLITLFIVRPNMRKVGAEVGSIFIEFEKLHQAEFAMKNMKGRRYVGKEIRCAFIDEDVFHNDLQLKKENK